MGSKPDFTGDNGFGPWPTLGMRKGVRLCICLTSLSYDAVIMFIYAMNSLSP